MLTLLCCVCIFAIVMYTNAAKKRTVQNWFCPQCPGILPCTRTDQAVCPAAAPCACPVCESCQVNAQEAVRLSAEYSPLLPLVLGVFTTKGGLSVPTVYHAVCAMVFFIGPPAFNSPAVHYIPSVEQILILMVAGSAYDPKNVQNLDKFKAAHQAGIAEMDALMGAPFPYQTQMTANMAKLKALNTNGTSAPPP